MDDDATEEEYSEGDDESENDDDSGGSKKKKSKGKRGRKASLPGHVAAPVCEKCWCDFTSMGGLKYHTAQSVCETYKKKETREFAEGESIECPTCHRSFTSSNCLRYHLERASICLVKKDEEVVSRLLSSLYARVARPKVQSQPQPSKLISAKPRPPGKMRPVVSGFSSAFASRTVKKGSSINMVVVKQARDGDEEKDGDDDVSEGAGGGGGGGGGEASFRESDTEYVDETGDFMDER